MRNRAHSRQNTVCRLALEALETRVVPAVVLDYDLVAKKPADFSANSLIIQLPDGAKPDYSVGAYAPGLKLAKAYPLVPGMYQANLTGQKLVQTLDALKANSRVQLVQPDAKITAQMIPNDSRFSELWAMNNSGQTGGGFDADIDAAEAWDKATGTGQTVVAVIDTGVDYTHPDLKDNIWTNTREIAGNGRDDDGNGYVDDIRGWDFFNNDANPMDDNGHGTHVSGTIGAVGNNSIGVAGVNWRTKIMPLKFLGGDGSGYLSGAIDAVNYAVANGARLSNNSWGGGPYDATLGKAISNAAAKGHIFVAAAGNDSQNNDTTTSYPSGYNYDNIVAVAATDHLDNLAYFSNYGVNTVDIAAPGVNILSTLPGNTYGSYSGTSMATPHVTGALSLYWDANPKATYKEVISALYQSADTVSTLTNYVGGGGRRMNVAKLLGSNNNPGPDVAGAKVTAGAFTQTSGQATGATLTFSEAIDPATFTTADVSLTGPTGSLSITAVQAVAGSGNTKFTVSFAALTTDGTYTLKVGPNVNDTAGNPMDQNGNGVNGEASDTWSADWVVSPPPADKTGARVTAGKFTLTNNQATGAALTFSEAIDPATFTLDDIVLAGPSGTLSVSSVAAVGGSGNTQFNITFPALTAAGTYTITVGPNIQDAAGNLMDQNNNGVNGESSDTWSANWVVNSQPPADTTGAKVTSGQWILQGGLAVAARLNFSEAITPASFTTADVALTGPGGSVSITSVKVVTGTGNKQFLISFGSALQEPGTYTLKVGPQVNDAAGNPMDQNGNGVNGEPGDAFTTDWVIKPPADLQGAKVINGFFNLTEGIATGVTLTFSEPVDLASFTGEDVVIQGPQGKYTADSVKAVEGTGNTRFVVSFKPMIANGAYTVTVGPGIADRSGNLMDQNGDGMKGQSNDAYGMSWQVGPGGQEFTSNREFQIGDMRYIMSTIWVDKDITITDLNVKLNIEHTAVGDLNIVLLSPRFVPYTLVAGRGGVGDNFTATVLDDQASVAIREGVAPFSGSFRPEVSLAGLNGQNARGGWTLVVGDTKYRDSGKLVNWTLEFNAQAQPQGTAVKMAAREKARASATLKEIQVANIWKGGALLSIQSDAAPSVALEPANPQAPPRLFQPTAIRARMVAQMDQAIWARMVEEGMGSRKKAF